MDTKNIQYAELAKFNSVEQCNAVLLQFVQQQDVERLSFLLQDRKYELNTVVFDVIVKASWKHVIYHVLKAAVKIHPDVYDRVFLISVQTRNLDCLKLVLREKKFELTPFVLNLLIDFDWMSVLDETLDAAVCINVEVYDWLCICWGKEKTDAYFKHRNDLDENCGFVFSSDLKLDRKWVDLIERRDFNAVPPYILEKLIGSNLYGNAVEGHLLRTQFDVYAPIVFEKGHKSSFRYVKGGSEYLQKQGLDVKF